MTHSVIKTILHYILKRMSPNLTEKERLVLGLLRMGLTNKQMAESTGLSVNTIKTHLKNVFNKLKVDNRTQASLMAHEILDK